MSNSLQPHGLQHDMLPSPSPTPGTCSNSCPSNHVILFCPLLLLPSNFPSIRVFSNESVLRIRWPKYWSLSISPSNEYLGLISFRIDWLDQPVASGIKNTQFLDLVKEKWKEKKSSWLCDIDRKTTTRSQQETIANYKFQPFIIFLFPLKSSKNFSLVLDLSKWWCNLNYPLAHH